MQAKHNNLLFTENDLYSDFPEVQTFHHIDSKYDEKDAQHVCSNPKLERDRKYATKKTVSCGGHHYDKGCFLSAAYHGDPQTGKFRVKKYNVETGKNKAGKQKDDNYTYQVNICTNSEKDEDHKIKKEGEQYEYYQCCGHHMAFHGDPLREPLKLNKRDGTLEEI